MDLQVVFPHWSARCHQRKLRMFGALWWDTHLRTFLQRLLLYNFRLLRLVHVVFCYFQLLLRTPFDLVASLERALHCSHQISHVVICGWLLEDNIFIIEGLLALQTDKQVDLEMRFLLCLPTWTGMLNWRIEWNVDNYVRKLGLNWMSWFCFLLVSLMSSWRQTSREGIHMSGTRLKCRTTRCWEF